MTMPEIVHIGDDINLHRPADCAIHGSVAQIVD